MDETELAGIAENHSPDPGYGGACGHCGPESGPWPCLVVVLITEVRRLRAIAYCERGHEQFGCVCENDD